MSIILTYGRVGRIKEIKKGCEQNARNFKRTRKNHQVSIRQRYINQQFSGDVRSWQTGFGGLSVRPKKEPKRKSDYFKNHF